MPLGKVEETSVFKLPNLKLVIDAISSREDEEPLYQGHKLINYTREKRYFEYHATHIVQTMINCFERLYGNLFGGEEKYEVNVNSLSNHLTLSFIYICAVTFNFFAL